MVGYLIAICTQRRRCDDWAMRMAVLLLALAPVAAFANPIGGVVTAGGASISSAGTTTTVTQTSDRAVIDWRGFDIGAGETTNFAQPGSSSVAVNRVNSTTASHIDGTLTANGNLVILNQNGVLFGSGAKVDVSGLVASTANLDVNELMNNGKLALSTQGNNPNATVSNAGEITAHDAGLVGFVAPNVANSGIINAKMGRVQLASGDTATVDLYGDGLMEVATSGAVSSQLVSNSGRITANGGTIAMTASAGGNIINSLIVNSGVLRAKTVSSHNGVITIADSSVGGTIKHSGRIYASGSKPGTSGGTVKLTADHVILTAGSRIDASGPAGGGAIWVGGGPGGSGTGWNAQTTAIEAGAILSANATLSGDGGNVVVWSDRATSYQGSIFARGGSMGGNGGTVEVSSAGQLNFAGMVDTTAAHGKTGALLLDPSDIEIADGTGDGAADGTNTFSGSAIGTVTAGDTGPSIIYESELEGIAATTNISLAATNSITIDALTDGNLNLAQTPGNSVSFTAGAGGFTMLNTSNTITTAGGALTITTTGGGGATIGNLATNGGLVTLNLDGPSTVAGTISGTGGLNNIGAGTVTLSAANSYTGLTTVSAGTLTVGTNNAVAGDLTVSGGTFDIGGNSDTVGAVTLTSGNITGTSGVLTGTSYAVQAGSISAILGGSGALTKTTSGAVTLANANSYTGLTTVSAGTLTESTSNALSSGDVTVNGGIFDIGENSDTVGVVTLTSGSITGTTGVLTGTSYAVQSGTISAILAGTGNLTKTTSGTVTLSGADTYTGATIINGGTLTLGANNVFSGSNTALTVNDLLGSTAVLNLNGYNAGIGALTLGGAGATATSVNNVSTGVGTLTLAGNVTFTNTNNPLGSTISGLLDLGAATRTLTINDSSNATNDLTISAVISSGSGTYGIIKAGSGTLLLSGVNTYTGITTLNAGVTSVSSIGNGGVAGNLGAATNAAANLVLGGGTLQYTGATASTDRNYILTAATTSTLNISTSTATLTESGASTATTGAFTKSGAGGLTLSGNNLATGTTTVSAGTLTEGTSNALASGALTVSGGTFALGANSDTVGAVTLTSGTISSSTGTLTGTSYAVQAGTISAILAGTGNLTKTTTGLVTLSGTNTYTGITAINAGTLAVTTIGNGGVAGNLGQATNAAANLVLGGGVLQYNGTTSSTDRNYTLTAGTTSSISVNVGSTNLTMSGASTATTGGLTKIGTGTLTLTGNNLATGTTTVSNGTLTEGVSNALASGGLSVNGGTFALGANSDTVGAVGLVTGTISSSTGVLTGTSYAVQSGTISAILAGTGNLTKTTSGTVTLSGANTYTGTTTINGGTLTLGANNALSSSTNVTVNDLLGSTALFNLNGFNQTIGTLTFGGASAMATSVNNVSTGAGTLTLGGDITTVATNNPLGSTISGLLDLGTATRNITVADSTNAAADLTISAIISSGSGTYGITKAGAGTLVLSGANTYTGATTINGGTLQLGAANRIADTSAVTIGASGTFNLNNFNETVASVTNSGAISLGTGNTLTTTGALSGSGQITGGTVSLVSTGGGVITAANTTNDFTGTLSISTTGAVSVADVNALTLGAVSGSTVFAQAGGDLTLVGTVQASATTGTPIVLVSSGNFHNNVGSTVLQPGTGGSWQVYSTDPSLDSRNGLTYNFKQYNATYGTTVQGTGNGFLYSLAPVIIATISGTVTKQYDGTTGAVLTPANYVVNGAVDSDTITLTTPSSGAYASPNVSSSDTVSASGVGIAATTNGGVNVYGYQLGSVTATGLVGSITARPLTILAGNQSQTYGDGNNFTAGFSITGGSTISGENVTGVTLTTDAINSSSTNWEYRATPWTITPSAATGTGGFLASNYAITYLPGTLTILQKALSVTAAATNKTYDGTTTAPITLTDTHVSGDVLTDSATATNFASSNVGSTIAVSVTGISISGTDAGNYVLSNTTASSSAAINARPITLKATNQNQTYGDGNNLTAGFSLTSGSMASGENVTGVTLVTDATSSSSGNWNYRGTPWTITPSAAVGSGGFATSNYAITYAPGTLTIAQKSLTVSAIAANKTYDGTTTASISLTDSPIAGDHLTPSATVANFTSPNAGSAVTVNVTGISISGADAGNYSVNTTATTHADILAAALTLTITANNASVMYGTPIAFGPGSAAFTATGFATGESITSVTLTSNATASQGGYLNVGNWTITLSNPVGNFVPANYVMSFVPGSLTITPRPLVISATGIDKIYDGTTAAQVTLGDNRLAGDLFTNETASAQFADPNAATGKAVSVTGISISGGDAANYSFNTTASTQADIIPKVLTVTAQPQEIAQGALVPGTTLSYAGFIPGEGIAVLLSLPGVSSAHSGLLVPSGTYLTNYMPYGGAAENYQFVYVAGALHVLGPVFSNADFTRTQAVLKPSLAPLQYDEPARSEVTSAMKLNFIRYTAMSDMQTGQPWQFFIAPELQQALQLDTAPSAF